MTEVRIAEQRRCQKMQHQLKIRIKLVFEWDLGKMTGFWDHLDIQHDQSLKMSRDQPVKDLTAWFEPLTKVPRTHLAPFSLFYRNSPRQVPLHSTLRSFISQYNKLHFDTSDPYLTVFRITARGYDVQTLTWKSHKEHIKPDELTPWRDEHVILLLVKYLCPQKRRIETLGCYYIKTCDNFNAMVNDGWVAERLQRHVSAHEVAPLPDDTEHLQCREEFRERDIQPRHMHRTVKIE